MINLKSHMCLTFDMYCLNLTRKKKKNAEIKKMKYDGKLQRNRSEDKTNLIISNSFNLKIK